MSIRYTDIHTYVRTLVRSEAYRTIHGYSKMTFDTKRIQTDRKTQAERQTDIFFHDWIIPCVVLLYLASYFKATLNV